MSRWLFVQLVDRHEVIGMDEVKRKPLLTPREGLINKAQRRVAEQRPPKLLVGAR